MRRAAIAVIVLVVFGTLFVAVGAPLWVSWAGIPSEVRVFPGTELLLNVQLPFRLFDEAGSDVTGDTRQFSFQADELGTKKYLVSLLAFCRQRTCGGRGSAGAGDSGGRSVGYSSVPRAASEDGWGAQTDGNEYYLRDGDQPGDVIVSSDGQDFTGLSRSATW